MKNAEIRNLLEAELLELSNAGKSLSSEDFNRYYSCLLKLFSLDKASVFEQEKIYTAAYGNIGDFVSEFLEYTSPIIEKHKKKILYKSVLNTNTQLLFSPRLAEIALGCLLSIFLSKNSIAHISVFSTKSHIVISANGKSVLTAEGSSGCVKKITQLHSGRIICSSGADCSQISLALPIHSRLEPISIAPCSTTLCRLCRI